MPLCVSWESLLKGGLLSFLKETALPNLPCLEESPSSPRNFMPQEERPLGSSSPPSHPSSSPQGTGQSLPGMLDRGCWTGNAQESCLGTKTSSCRDWGAPAFCRSFLTERPISNNYSTECSAIGMLGHEELVQAPSLVSHRQQQSDGNNHGSLEGDLEVKGSISHYWFTELAA